MEEKTWRILMVQVRNRSQKKAMYHVAELLTDTYGPISESAVFLTPRNSITRMKPREEENFILLFPGLTPELYPAHASCSNDCWLTLLLFSE